MRLPGLSLAPGDESEATVKDDLAELPIVNLATPY
jgi:hypothetical protein